MATREVSEAEKIAMKAYHDLASTTGIIVAVAIVLTYLFTLSKCSKPAESMEDSSPNNPYPVYTGPGLALSNVYGTARSDPGFDTGLYGGVGAAEPFKDGKRLVPGGAAHLRDSRTGVRKFRDGARPFKHDKFLNGRGPLDMWAGNQYLQTYYDYEVSHPGDAGASTTIAPSTGAIDAATAASAANAAATAAANAANTAANAAATAANAASAANATTSSFRDGFAVTRAQAQNAMAEGSLHSILLGGS